MSVLVRPPRPAGDVCPVCLGLIYEVGFLCKNCDDNANALDGHVVPITAISLYERPGRLRDWLTFYKNGDESVANPRAAAAIGSIFATFFAENQLWLDALRADFAVVVPSTTRPAPHPLAELLSRKTDIPFRAPLHRTSELLGHNHPNRNAYDVVADVRGARILLIDDVYTSGARAQSAAYALRSRGADVVALCILGRRYNSSFSERAASVLADQKQVQFEWAVEPRSVEHRGANQFHGSVRS
jgi:predicted amidophosphoribosyltransferase